MQDAALDVEQPPPWRSPDVEHKSAGTRLLEAFEAFERFPMFAPTRGQLMDAEGGPKMGVDTVVAVESDLALTVAVLRKANRGRGRTQQVSTVPEALERIGEEGLKEVVDDAPSFDFFERSGSWGSAPERHRLHALATQRAAARVASALSYKRVDELLVAALLHDIGKLVLTHADARYSELPGAGALTPEQRIERERKALGVDHALVGGVLARRWMFPRELAHTIERHHQRGETGLPGLVRMADMIARFEAGNPIDPAQMQAAAESVGLDVEGLHEVLSTSAGSEGRSTEKSPLTPGEHRVVLELSKGRIYKDIAAALGVSVSTVRTHLYNVYKKIGVSDRAQAILLAKEKNWI